MKRTFKFKFAVWFLVFSTVCLAAAGGVFLVRQNVYSTNALKDGKVVGTDLETMDIILGDPGKFKKLDGQMKAKREDGEADRGNDNMGKAMNAGQLIKPVENAAQAGAPDDLKIAIIVQDLGLSRTMTVDAMTLPKTFTLGFSPYASEVNNWVERAVSDGYTALMKLPMQPVDYPVNDQGPHAILHNLTTSQNITRLEWILSRADKIAGVYSNYDENITEVKTSIVPILSFLGSRRVPFVSSNNQNFSSIISHSKDVSCDIISVDVLVDRELNEGAIMSSLKKLEDIVYVKGQAVGLMNGYPITISIVREWMKGLSDSGIRIVPITDIYPYSPSGLDVEVDGRKNISELDKKILDKADEFKRKYSSSGYAVVDDKNLS